MELLPFGDKMILEQIPADPDEIEGPVKAKVVAVGPGMPYGRGEFYAPTAAKGMTILVAQKEWKAADTFDWEGKKLRVVHERQCMTGIIQT